jgi:hypothetical protein
MLAGHVLVKDAPFDEPAAWAWAGLDVCERAQSRVWLVRGRGQSLLPDRLCELMLAVLLLWAACVQRACAVYRLWVCREVGPH